MGGFPFVKQNQNLLILVDNVVNIVKRVIMEFGPQQYYSSQKFASPVVQNLTMQSLKLNDANLVLKGALGV